MMKDCGMDGVKVVVSGVGNGCGTNVKVVGFSRVAVNC